MIKNITKLLIPLIVLAGAVFWYLTSPETITDTLLADIENGDPKAGEVMFWAGGCASCHAEDQAKDEAKLILTGGHGLNTPFGTFYAPNISSDPTNGIGSWNGTQFANAMMKGVAPDGSHYYPAFPYTSYGRMKIQDIADLWAFMKTLPAVSTPNKPHDLALPFKFRRGLGLWKMLYLNHDPIVTFEKVDDKLKRGQYLVEGPTHCGECHTPRNLFGGYDLKRWLAGGPSPDGKGKIPNITPHESGLGGWSLNDIVYSLESGLTPEFDSFGGSMTEVQENTAKLTPEDREAIATYLKAVQAVPTKLKSK